MKPFRVLMIDDLTAKILQEGARVQSATPEQPLWILKSLQEFADKRGESIEVFLSQDVSFKKRPVISIAPKDGEWHIDHLASLDVLILDLGGVGPLRREWILQKDDLPGEAVASEADLQLLNFAFPGAGFYLKLRNRQLKTCQAVIILSEHDIEAQQEAPEIIRRFIDPCCRPEIIPWTIKHTPSREKMERIVDLIEALYIDFANGFTLLKNRGAIEFAASHNEPVMIVGESGTGKEYIAEAIHRRWAQERRKEGYAVPDKPVVVNCAGLSPELAKSELFGYVRGSFTGAYDHRVGAILQACGIQGIGSQRQAISTKRLQKISSEYRRLAECIRKFDNVSNEQKLSLLCEELLPLLNELIVAKELTQSPFAYFSNLHRRIQQAVEGPDYVAEYQREMVQHNSGLVKAEEVDIIFTRGHPHSTLFLDEFADLAPDVQTLLLRYLQNKEVQPIGYPGRIEGANARIIVASSDPRIAEFVGERLTGGWRSQEELKRPLREDLIFRVKGQVIRACPVTKENVRGCIQHFVKRNGIAWREETISYLTDLMSQQLDEIQQAMDDFEEGRRARKSPSFGHLREISRAVSMINAYVLTAQKRGLRSIQSRVTPEIVKTVWRPSTVVSFDAVIPIFEEHGDKQTKIHKKAQALRQAIEKFFTNGQYQPLPKLWDNKAFRKKLNAMVKDKDLDGLLNLQSLVVKEHTIPVYCAAFGIDESKEGTIRAWFTRKIKVLTG